MALSDQRLLEEHAEQRGLGHTDVARERWEELTLRNFPRIREAVKAFRFSPGGPRLPEVEWGSATSEAYLRVMAMGASFEAASIEAFYAALQTCVQNSCRDYGRKEFRHALRAGGSLDERWAPDQDAGPYDKALGAYDQELRAGREEALAREARAQKAERTVRAAIAQIENESYRAVLERTYGEAPMTGEAIAAELSISLENVYKRRERGIKQLERILHEHFQG